MNRTCTEPGCDKPHRAKGLCSTHYNQRIPDRHTKFLITCIVCGSEHWSARRTGIYCSQACKAEHFKRIGRRPQCPPEKRKWTKRQHARVKAWRAAKGTRGRTWVSGRCERCGKPFIAPCLGGQESLARYCGEACSRAARHARRRARKRKAQVERYSRLAVFERDQWRCHICRRKVRKGTVVPHPLAPTIDHLVPLFDGGSDTAANVATAHFVCNSTKGERAGRFGDQLALIG